MLVILLLTTPFHPLLFPPFFPHNFRSRSADQLSPDCQIVKAERADWLEVPGKRPDGCLITTLASFLPATTELQRPAPPQDKSRQTSTLRGAMFGFLGPRRSPDLSGPADEPLVCTSGS